jgi:hypothetical protein
LGFASVLLCSIRFCERGVASTSPLLQVVAPDGIRQAKRSDSLSYTSFVPIFLSREKNRRFGVTAVEIAFASLWSPVRSSHRTRSGTRAEWINFCSARK